MRSNNARYNLALIMSHWILALMLLISQTKETIERTVAVANARGAVYVVGFAVHTFLASYWPVA
jgi:hypothetical protein